MLVPSLVALLYAYPSAPIVATLSSREENDERVETKLDNLRIDSICSFDEEEDSVICSIDLLPPQGKIRRTISNTSFDKFSILEKYISQSCIGYLEMELQIVEDNFQIDWNKSAFVRNGQVVQLLPGTYRKITSSLSQKPTYVPEGAILTETIHPLDEECILDFTRGYVQKASLSLHIIRGNKEEKLVWEISGSETSYTLEEVIESYEIGSILDPPSGRTEAPIEASIERMEPVEVSQEELIWNYICIPMGTLSIIGGAALCLTFPLFPVNLGIGTLPVVNGRLTACLAGLGGMMFGPAAAGFGIALTYLINGDVREEVKNENQRRLDIEERNREKHDEYQRQLSEYNSYLNQFEVYTSRKKVQDAWINKRVKERRSSAQ